MKNIYEITQKDKDKYREEFNKLKFTKNINATRGPALCISIIGMIIICAMCFVMNKTANVQAYLIIVEFITGIAIATFIILQIYLSISFVRWMKIKHNIEY